MNRGYGTSGSLGEAYKVQQLIVDMILLTSLEPLEKPVCFTCNGIGIITIESTNSYSW